MQDYSELAGYVERAKAQDEAAFAYIYEHTYSIVYNIACAALQNEEEARDVVSEVYIRVFRGLPSLQDNRSFMRWLVVITQHVCSDHRSEWQPPVRSLPLSTDAGTENDPIAEWHQRESLHTLMQDMIRHLPEAQQRAIYCVYFKQLTIGQTAALEGCSINTIKSRLHYARASLRQAILDEERRTGDKYHLPVAAVALASIMALPQVGFTLSSAAAAQIFSVVMTALGIQYTGPEALSFYTVTEETVEEKDNWLTRLWRRSYLIKLKPAVLILLTLLLLLTTLVITTAGFARSRREDEPMSDAIVPAQTSGLSENANADIASAINLQPKTAAEPSPDGATARVDGVAYTYTITDDTATITSAVIEQSTSYLTLPKELGGCPVTALTAPTIENSSGVVTLRIPATMDIVPSDDVPHAFALMPDLETIFVSGGSTTLRSSQGVLYSANMDTLLIYPAAKPENHYYVHSTTKVLAPHSMVGRELIMVDLPEGLLEIGAWCFVRSESLKTLTVPSTVTKVGENALGTPSIEKILVTRGNENFYSISGALYNYDRTVLIRYPAGMVNPSHNVRTGTTTIEPYAFYEANNLYMLTLPDSVTTIRSHAISKMSNLEILNLPDNITELPAYALAENTAISAYRLPKALKTLDSYAFDHCMTLDEIVFTGDAPEPAQIELYGIPESTVIRRADEQTE